MAIVKVEQTEGGKIAVMVQGAGVVTLDPAKISDANKAYAMFHGLKQRMVDAAALSRDPANGAAASPADKMAAIQAIVEHLESGSAEWSRVGSGGGGKSITIEAIAQIKGVKYDVAEEYVAEFAKTGKDGKGNAFDGDTKKALAFLRDGKRVREAIEAIRASRTTAPKVDADAALDELTK